MPWLVCDYGEVLSLPPPQDEWQLLCQAAGYENTDDFHDAYWGHRPEYDRADLTAPEYWSLVAKAGFDLANLVELDVAMWLHADRQSVDAAIRAGERGFRLALLSNAPVEVAAGIDSRDWLQPFERRFYSCHLRATKPSPQAYVQVLDELGADPGDIWFFDDRPVNVEAAAQLGILAYLYQSPEQFDLLRAG